MTELALLHEWGESTHRQHLESLLSDIDSRFAEIGPVYRELLATQHRLFDIGLSDEPSLNDSRLDPTLPTDEQLYDEETYNIDFYRNDLDLRKWGAITHADAATLLDTSPEDSAEAVEKKRLYRTTVRRAAAQLGFISHESRPASHPDDIALGIEDSELEPITGKVDAIIIPGAAGLTNHKRLRDSIKNIESGKIDTERIIITACERPVTDREKQNISHAGFNSGDTEFELCYAALNDLTTGFNSGYVDFQLPVHFPGSTEQARVVSGIVEIGGRQIGVDLLSAPFDPHRKLADGKPANRALTDETFIPALTLLPEGEGTIVVESHDTWAPAQTLTAQRIFGLEADKKVIGTGPFNADRLVGDNDLNKASEVVSDMMKYIYELRKLRVAIATEIEKQAA